MGNNSPTRDLKFPNKGSGKSVFEKKSFNFDFDYQRLTILFVFFTPDRLFFFIGEFFGTLFDLNNDNEHSERAEFFHANRRSIDRATQ